MNHWNHHGSNWHGSNWHGNHWGHGHHWGHGKVEKREASEKEAVEKVNDDVRAGIHVVSPNL